MGEEAHAFGNVPPVLNGDITEYLIEKHHMGKFPENKSMCRYQTWKDLLLRYLHINIVSLLD